MPAPVVDQCKLISTEGLHYLTKGQPEIQNVIEIWESLKHQAIEKQEVELPVNYFG